MKERRLSSLSDVHLLAEAERLARCERDVTVMLIVHLAEIEARELHLAAGFPSMFGYCTEVLRLSEHAAYHRILAARTAVRFPRILDMLEDGALTLTSVRLLAQHLTDVNCEGLLAAAAGRSRREVEKLLAAHAPQPDVPDSIRKLADPNRTPAPPSGMTARVTGDASERTHARPAAPDVPPLAASAAKPPLPAAQRPVVTPLSPERYQVTFTASEETCDLLRQAKELLSHAVPDGNTDEVVKRALKALVAELARRKHAATDRPRPGRSTAARSRHIPADVKRQVQHRDDGRCAFVARDGRRCRERRYLEYHHVDPYVLGGEATVEQTELRCRAHNNYEARVWGLGWKGTAAAGEAVETTRVRWTSHSARAEFERRRPSS